MQELSAVYKQVALVAYLQAAPEAVRNKVLGEFESIGMADVFGGYADAMRCQRSVNSRTDAAATDIRPPPVVLYKDLPDCFARGGAVVKTLKMANLATKERADLKMVGLRALAAGEVEVVVLAGGQGSRLGYDGPKGCYMLNLPHPMSIFAIVFGRLAALNNVVRTEVDSNFAGLSVLVMTSEHNHDSTVKHFRDNEFFGHKSVNINFFMQSVMPSFDVENGSVLLQDSSSITRNPNGNGGVFASLRRAGLLEEMAARGVKYLHVVGVDNVLVKMGDPVFLGACITARVSAGNKCVSKRDQHEKVGVQVIRVSKTLDGEEKMVPAVVEYTEISEGMAAAIDENGQLRFSASNIVNHFFHLDLIRNAPLSYHVAIKKVPYFDYSAKHRDLQQNTPKRESDYMVIPTEPNAVKLEYFIFDAFEAAPALLVVEGSRSEEFSPVKNAEGSDSPITAAADLLSLQARYLNEAGNPHSGQLPPGATYEGEAIQADTPVWN